MHDIATKRRFRRTSLALLLAVGFFCLWTLNRHPGGSPAAEAVQAATRVLPQAVKSPAPEAQPDPVGFSAEQPEDLLQQVRGEPRPAPQVQRGRNHRRVFDEPAVRAVEVADTEPQHPFTGLARLRLNEQVPDHHLAVSAIALGVSYETFAALPAQAHPRIVIPLEQNLSVTFRVQKVMERGPVTHSYFGVIEEHPESITQLVYNDGAVTGHFVLYSDDTHPTRHYEIKYLTEDLVAVHKLDESAFHPEGGNGCGICAHPEKLLVGDVMDAVPGDDLDEGVLSEGAAENHAADGRTVDLVVGYGREAREADGGAANIEARVIAAVDRMNQAFVNSQIDGRMVLLGMIEDPDYLEADYSNINSVYNDLANGLATNPALNTVTGLRTALGADFVKFVPNDSKGGIAGLAAVPGAVSVTVRTHISSTFTFEHELGHNLGGHHAWADQDSPHQRATNRVYHGWRFSRPDGSTRRSTIQAYTSGWGSRVLHYSNPDVDYDYGSGVQVATGAVQGYDASEDPTVDPRLVSGGLMSGDAGPGFDGSHQYLGANVAAVIDQGQPGGGDWGSGIVARGSSLSRASLAVTYPTQAETLIAWESTAIEWVGGTWHSPVRLALYQGGTSPGDKVSDIAILPENGYRVFAWTPGAGLAGSDFRIRLINNEGEDFEESAFSGSFSIEAPDTVGFQYPEYAVSENAGSLTVTVTRVGIDGGAVSVEYETLDGTAVGGVNFVADSGTLHWPDGDDAPKSFQIGLIDNEIYDEPDLHFSVRLSNPQNAIIHPADAAQITLNEVLPPPVYTVSYFANGADGPPPASQNKTHNQPLTLAGSGGLSNAGHTFVGWNTLADGSGQEYQPGDLYEINTDLTLYAQWVTGYTVVIDFGKPGQETGGYWNNITGDGDWPDGTILSLSLVRFSDGGQTGARLRVQQVTGSGRAGIGGHDIEPENQEDQAAFSISGSLPGSAQRDIAYFTSDGQAQFVFENLDDSLEYQLEFQTLHKNTTPAGNWTLQSGTQHEQTRQVSRNKGATHYSPVQVFENIQTDGAGRIVLRSAGDVAQSINALELTAVLPLNPGPSGDPAQPENPGGGTGITYYLDVNTGNDSHSGLSEAAAWQTFQHATNTLQPGDTVLIREGDYTSAGNDEYKNWNITTSGTPGQYITYRAYPGERPRFHVDTWNGIQLWNVSYVEIDGLEVLGLPDPAWLAAEPENSPARNTLAQDRRYFGGGITVTHNGTEPHHLRIRHNLVHQVGGNGIGFRGGNMILVEGNTVHSSTHRSDAGNSAISFVELNSSIHPGSVYGVVVRNNTLYNNRNMVAFKWVGYITDGNGVIIDYCENYTDDRILIANNLAYHNGGRAFHVYFGKNVDILHNTAYHNLISPDVQWSGELSSDAPGGETNTSIHFHNNIAIARADRRAYNIANTTNWQFTRNVTQSPRAPATPVDGAQNLLQTDPLFADPGALDFPLQAASPAIDYGLVFAEVPEDADGSARQGSAPDAGAFEFVSLPNSPPTVTISAPADNTTVTQGDEVMFSGTAIDVEDGELTASISWTSSRDGALGAGGNLSTTTLSVGTHTVTASVTDIGGLTGSASVTLTVQEAVSDSVLVRYTFLNVPSVGSQHSTATFVRQAAAESVAAEITATPFQIRNDGGNAARLIATDSANGIAGAAQIAGIQSDTFQWESGASSNPYFEFTVEGAATMETLRMMARSGSQWNNSGAFLAYDANRRAEISIRSSLDNFAANIGAVFLAGNAGAFAEQIIDLSTLEVAGHAVTFRIYTRSPNDTDPWHRTQIDLIEVTGEVEAPPIDPYDTWAVENGIEGSATDLTNGVPNLLRYALGGTAVSPEEEFWLEPVVNASGMSLSFTRIDDPGLTYEVWATDNLLDWGDSPYWSGQGSGVGEVQVPALGAQLYLYLRVRRE